MKKNKMQKETGWISGFETKSIFSEKPAGSQECSRRLLMAGSQSADRYQLSIFWVFCIVRTTRFCHLSID